MLNVVTELTEVFHVVQWCQQGLRALPHGGICQQIVGDSAIGVPKPEGELRNVASIAEEETRQEPSLRWQGKMSTAGVIMESQTGLVWKGP